MVNVPVYKSHVENIPMPSARQAGGATAGMFGATQARQIGQLGQVAERTAGRLFEIQETERRELERQEQIEQDKLDKANAREAYNNFQENMLNTQNTIFAKNGKNAIGSVEEYSEFYKTQKQDVDLSGNALEYFNASADRFYNRTLPSVSSFQFQQRQNYEKDTLIKENINITNESITNISNFDIIQEGYEDILANIAGLNSGAGASAIKQAKQSAGDLYISTITEAMSSIVSNEAALSFMEKNETKFLSLNYDALHEKIEIKAQEEKFLKLLETLQGQPVDIQNEVINKEITESDLQEKFRVRLHRRERYNRIRLNEEEVKRVNLKKINQIEEMNKLWDTPLTGIQVSKLEFDGKINKRQANLLLEKNNLIGKPIDITGISESQKFEVKRNLDVLSEGGKLKEETIRKLIKDGIVSEKEGRQYLSVSDKAKEKIKSEEKKAKAIELKAVAKAEEEAAKITEAGLKEEQDIKDRVTEFDFLTIINDRIKEGLPINAILESGVSKGWITPKEAIRYKEEITEKEAKALLVTEKTKAEELEEAAKVLKKKEEIKEKALKEVEKRQNEFNTLKTITTQIEDIDTPVSVVNKTIKSAIDAGSITPLKAMLFKEKLKNRGIEKVKGIKRLTKGEQARGSVAYLDYKTSFTEKDNKTAEDISDFIENTYESINTGFIPKKEGIEYVNEYTDDLAKALTTELENFTNSLDVDTKLGYGKLEDYFEKNIEITVWYKGETEEEHRLEDNNKIRLYQYYNDSLKKQAEAENTTIGGIALLPLGKKETILTQAFNDAVQQYSKNRFPALISREGMATKILSDSNGLTYGGGEGDLKGKAVALKGVDYSLASKIVDGVTYYAAKYDDGRIANISKQQYMSMGGR